jgi:hypothetical protein
MKIACILALLVCLGATGAYAQESECKIGDFSMGMKRSDFDRLNVRLRLNEFNDPTKYICETKEKFIDALSEKMKPQQAAALYDSACSQPMNEFAFSRAEVEKIYGRKLLSPTAFAKEFGDAGGFAMKQFSSSGGQKDFIQGYRFEDPATGCRIEIHDNMTVMFRNTKAKSSPAPQAAP